MHSLNFREFILADDIFTTANECATEASEVIISTGMKMNWMYSNGIRVENANRHMLEVMRKAGCYHVVFSFESGNDIGQGTSD